MSIYQSPTRDPGDLKLYGPRIEIKVGRPILTPSGVKPESNLRFSTMPALIDTGAQRTVLAPEAVQRVGLSKINEVTLIRAGGFVNAGVYVASMQFPRCPFSLITVMEVSSCELPHPLIQCLLGRDVLSRWVFTYDGPTGGWQITEDGAPGSVEPPEGVDLWGA